MRVERTEPPPLKGYAPIVRNLQLVRASSQGSDIRVCGFFVETPVVTPKLRRSKYGECFSG